MKQGHPTIRGMRAPLGVVLTAGLLTMAGSASAQEEGGPMKIKFTLDGTLVSATLEDSAATRGLVAQLPLTLTLEDYASTEKIAGLPEKLSTEGAPEGITPKAGDVTYYAPWGNLALFQKDFRYSAGLVRLGRIEEGFEALLKPGSADVTIELLRN
ncbi:cyclophilin-like fold protein [Mesorhizobium sp. M0166]|uniref:cyclophilin-like fold protein n=1 Tax=unclassified Mesorhizobium TaxID=325217 RepID=UPI00333742E9